MPAMFTKREDFIYNIYSKQWKAPLMVSQKSASSYYSNPLNLTTLKLNDILTINLFYIKFNDEWWYEECEIDPHGRSWNDKCK